MPLESAIIRQPGEGLALGVLEGRLEYGPELQNIKTQLMPLVEKPGTVLILDLSKIEYADSAGLGMLLFLNGAAKDVGASLRLAGPSPRLIEIFQITHTAAIFIVDPDIDTSLKHAAKVI
jgi:anti-sigma B factor antagonist